MDNSPALSLITLNPGIGRPELASKLKISQNSLDYRIKHLAGKVFKQSSSGYTGYFTVEYAREHNLSDNIVTRMRESKHDHGPESLEILARITLINSLWISRSPI